MKHLYAILLFAIIFSCDKKEVKKEEEKPVIVEKPVEKDTIVVVEEVKELPKVKEKELIFTNQVAADTKPVSWLKGEKNVKLYKENGWYKYRIGEHKTYKAARNARYLLLETYDEVFVQALLDGQPIHIKEALKIQDSKK